MCPEKNRYIQVRFKQGGGTRHLSLSQEDKPLIVLEKAKNLFFPDGNSAKGNLQDFHCTLLDFKQLPVDNGLSIGDIFNITGVTKLRFYLATKNACSDSDGSVHLESNDSDVSSLQHVAFEEKEENHETSDLMVRHFFILITYTY